MQSTDSRFYFSQMHSITILLSDMPCLI